MKIGQLNAIKYCGTGQRVVVSHNTENGYRHDVGYLVSDTVDRVIIITQGTDIKVKIESIKAVTLA